MQYPHSRFKLRTTTLAVITVLGGFALPGSAAETTLKDTVVSATLSEHETRTAPASVTVITREELETRNATDLLDAVRGSPGITLSPRQVGGRKTLALRGLEGKHTLTLIDGRRISPSDDVVGHSDYQYGWLPISAIERVEIIRGPMSTLYGSEALGGVINLITRQPKDKWIGSLMLSGSTLFDADTDGGQGSQGSVFAAGPLGERITLRVNGEATRRAAVENKDDRRYSEIEGNRTRTAGLGGTIKLTEAQSLDVQWSKGDEVRTYDDVSSTKTYENRYDIEKSQASIAWKGEFGSWRSQVRAYRSEIDITNTRTNGVSATRPQNMSDEVVDAFAALKLGGQTVTVGGEYRTETLKNSGLIGGKDSATHKALFVQDEIALGQSLMLTAGVRGDEHEIFGFEASPRAYLVWEASPELIIKGGYGHAFKAPTLKQISPSYVGAEGPHTFLGNGDIQPEKSDSLEIGADWKRGPLNLRATLFHTRVDDLITYRQIKTVGVRRTYLYDNVDKATISGLETGFSWNINSALLWNTNLTLLKTKDESTGTELNDRPGVMLAATVDWSIGQGWSSRGAVEYYGRQTSSAGDLPAYSLWNASVGKRFDKIFSLRAGVNNLTDVRLADKSPNFGYAELGRNLYVTLRADF
ncbi:TonB-dependent receptor plug domain-containing protein [Dechloromonas denitrificans]|uniref:TonB-dependent receptor plug domain-containing protein n=1 Tax=Dechloromonas denitrificans TaxID=281362 RepID=UPI001CF884AB|nr:TonB-dependent receptor [Dechloromonas denitrificans]UCV02602.1 TonB-dependent receptor [Dechloromonas denitrificans]UCV06898.1 TonB-dependent receptor [Dechloromonas denitrificans]